MKRWCTLLFELLEYMFAIDCGMPCSEAAYAFEEATDENGAADGVHVGHC